jgi:hypothetical protein
MSRAGPTAAAIAAGVAALLVGATLAGGPEELDAATESAEQPVLRSTSVCSNVGGEPDATSRLGMFAIPGVPEPPADADADATPIAATRLAGPDAEEPDEPFASLNERGVRTLEKASSSNAASYAVRAEGQLAPGVATEQWASSTGTDLRGLATGSCGTPGREFWFVGGSSHPDRRARLVLSNPTSTPATVDLALWSGSGPVEVDGTDELALPPNSQEVLLFEAIAPENEHLAVQVRATRGRIVAAIDNREKSDGESTGTSMIPAATAPTETVVVPGVPGRGKRSLRIVAPGENDAIVNLEVLSADGAYSPVGLDVLTVPAGSVLEVPVDEAVGSDPTAIRLISDEPITAGLRVADTMEDGRPDIAFTAATAALPAGSLASVFGVDSATVNTTLVFSAVGDAGGRVVVRTVDGEGATVGETPVEIPAGSTQAVPLERPEDSVWTTTVIEVAAGNTVAGARIIDGEDDDGRIMDVMPLTEPQTTVPVPDISAELTP